MIFSSCSFFSSFFSMWVILLSYWKCIKLVRFRKSVYMAELFQQITHMQAEPFFLFFYKMHCLSLWKKQTNEWTKPCNVTSALMCLTIFLGTPQIFEAFRQITNSHVFANWQNYPGRVNVILQNHSAGVQVI